MYLRAFERMYVFYNKGFVFMLSLFSSSVALDSFERNGSMGDFLKVCPIVVVRFMRLKRFVNAFHSIRLLRNVPFLSLLFR